MNSTIESRSESQRPFAVTAIAGLFLAIGIAGLVRPIVWRATHNSFPAEASWVLALSAVAVACGALLLRRQSWARWLSLAWIAAHVGISFLNSLQEVAIHAVFLILIGYLLFRHDANSWFRHAAGSDTAQE